MRLNGLEKLRWAARRLRHGFGSRVLVLLYHRVIALPSDPYLLCVTPQHFAQHLEILQKRYNTISLKDLAQGFIDGKLPRRAVAISFDDGYADNLQNAKVLLEKYGIPATVFVATGHIDQEREFWWDELEALLLRPGDLPKTLELRIDGELACWSLGEAAHYDETTYRLCSSWNVERNDPHPRQQMFRDLYRALFPLRPEEQQKALDQMWEWAGAERLSRPTHRTLTRTEAKELADGGLVDVGAHTVSHPILSALSAGTQRDEIEKSKAHLDQILGHPVQSFAYPFGLLSTYTDETVAAVREAGFACACSNFVDVVSENSDRFQLPRLAVQDWDRATFSRLLEEWLG